MRTLHLRARCAAASTLVLALVLASRDVGRGASTDAPAQPKPVGRQVEQDIRRWDLNKNGRLDPDELEAFRRDKLRERREQLELRQQGGIEARKLEAAQSGVPARVPPALLKQYDANTNGVLDPEEWAKYRDDLEKRKAARTASVIGTNAPAAVRAFDAPPPRGRTGEVPPQPHEHLERK